MMQYRAVDGRCAVIPGALRVPLSYEQILSLLREKGFVLIEVDLVALARQCVGVSCYRRGARPVEAPAVVDCSSFIKWLYGQRGIWLPRRSIQQRELGEVVELHNLIAGDVVFVSGRIDYYDDDPANGVGHVGIAIGAGKVMHAADRKLGVIESSLEAFVSEATFRGARRYMPRDVAVLTCETPERDIESVDDIRWIIFQSLPE